MTKAQRNAHNDRMNLLRNAAQQIVKAGVCPDCGSGIHRNLALAGWYQCDRFGEMSFRKDKTGEKCNFQTFTE